MPYVTSTGDEALGYSELKRAMRNVKAVRKFLGVPKLPSVEVDFACTERLNALFKQLSKGHESDITMEEWMNLFENPDRFRSQMEAEEEASVKEKQVADAATRQEAETEKAIAASISAEDPPAGAVAVAPGLIPSALPSPVPSAIQSANASGTATPQALSPQIAAASPVEPPPAAAAAQQPHAAASPEPVPAAAAEPAPP